MKPSATTPFFKNSETGRLLGRLPRQNRLGKPDAIYAFTPKESKVQSSSSSSWRPRVREDVASSTHSTGRPRVRLAPVPNRQKDPLINFQPTNDKDKDNQGSHHSEHVLKIGEIFLLFLKKIFRSMKRCRSMFMNDSMWADFYLGKGGDKFKIIVINHQIPKAQTIIEVVRKRLEKSLWQIGDTESLKNLYHVGKTNWTVLEKRSSCVL